jgi:predicted MFS family arabinose efflux permease
MRIEWRIRCSTCRSFEHRLFLGGLIAAFTMNGSLFAMLLYLVLYLQDDLGYSALATGVRLLLVSGCTLVSAVIAGRLSSHMPVRWLIGPGLLLVGIGLLLMAGITGTSSWTHMIPGFLVAGIGSGMVNPPLASTAVGVVTPERSGMASGVNTTFRQIGIATSIAGFGSIFTTSIRHHLTRSLASVPSAGGPRAPGRHSHPTRQRRKRVQNGAGERAGNIGWRNSREFRRCAQRPTYCERDSGLGRRGLLGSFD